MARTGKPKTGGKVERKALCVALDMDTVERLDELTGMNHMSRTAMLSYLIWHCKLRPVEYEGEETGDLA